MSEFRVRPQVLVIALLIVASPWLLRVISGILLMCLWEGLFTDHRIPAEQISGMAAWLHLPPDCRVVGAYSTGDWEPLRWYAFEVRPRQMEAIRRETVGQLKKWTEVEGTFSRDAPAWWDPGKKGDAEVYYQGTWSYVILCPKSGRVYCEN